MSKNDDFAAVCTVAEAKSTIVGRKLRIVGKFLSYDPSTYLLLLMDPPHGLLVDISLCLDPSQSLSFLNENKGTLMVIGTLERSESTLEVPELPKFVDAPTLDDQLVLRAILARSVNDIRLDEWRHGIESLKKVERLN